MKMLPLGKNKLEKMSKQGNTSVLFDVHRAK